MGSGVLMIRGSNKTATARDLYPWPFSLYYKYS